MNDFFVRRWYSIINRAQKADQVDQNWINPVFMRVWWAFKNWTRGGPQWTRSGPGLSASFSIACISETLYVGVCRWFSGKLPNTSSLKSDEHLGVCSHFCSKWKTACVWGRCFPLKNRVKPSTFQYLYPELCTSKTLTTSIFLLYSV